MCHIFRDMNGCLFMENDIEEYRNIPSSLFKDCWKLHLEVSACTYSQKYHSKK